VRLDRLKYRLVGTPAEGLARHLAALARMVGRRPETEEERKAHLIDQQTVEIARRVLRSDGNVVDVGANRGVLLKQLVALAPNGRHVAVEPLPRHAASLRRRFPNVTVYQAALSDVSGTAKFRRVIGVAEHSSLAGIGHDAMGRDVEIFDVPVRTLDEIAPDPVDFLKIDAEQAEYRILKGADRVLSQRPFIAFELGANQSEVWDLLTNRGYCINRLSDWLDRKPPPPNVDALRHDVKGEYFFVAYPASYQEAE
jgi:FkbM family methyltransferase